VKVSGIIAVDSRDTAVDLCPIGKDLFGDPFFMQKERLLKLLEQSA
jgi:hypothetical protein